MPLMCFPICTTFDNTMLNSSVYCRQQSESSKEIKEKIKYTLYDKYWHWLQVLLQFYTHPENWSEISYPKESNLMKTEVMWKISFIH